MPYDYPVGNVDFGMAARRHYADAEYLQADFRTANAGQLYGFAVECSLKWLLMRLNYDKISDIHIPSNIKLHVDKLAMLIAQQSVTFTGPNAARYSALAAPVVANIQGWMTDHRYCDAAVLPVAFARWQEAAKGAMSLMDAATVDGVPK